MADDNDMMVSDDAPQPTPPRPAVAAPSAPPAQPMTQPPPPNLILRGGVGGVGRPDPRMIGRIGPLNPPGSMMPGADQSAQAIEAAIRFQGQRGYQQDIASGMEAPKALAKWAPMMFRNQPKPPAPMSEFQKQNLDFQRQKWADEKVLKEKELAGTTAKAETGDETRRSRMRYSTLNTELQRIQKELEGMTPRGTAAKAAFAEKQKRSDAIEAQLRQYVDTGKFPEEAGATAPAGAAASKPGTPQPGTVIKGYRFKGGDPGDKSNWEKV